jgi:hypothetical protein
LVAAGRSPTDRPPTDGGSPTVGRPGTTRRSAGVARCGTPRGEIPGGETPGGETPGGETPGGETPGGETPGGETPGGETPGATPGEVLPGVDSPRRGGEGAGPGLAVAPPAVGEIPLGIPLGLPLLTRPLADAPLAWDCLPPPEGPPEGNESRSLRTTGASTVEEADFTYSPRSASFLSTSLLVTPSSFASSCTRALPATALLTAGAGGNPARPRY